MANMALADCEKVLPIFLAVKAQWIKLHNVPQWSKLYKEPSSIYTFSLSSDIKNPPVDIIAEQQGVLQLNIYESKIDQQGFLSTPRGKEGGGMLCICYAGWDFWLYLLLLLVYGTVLPTNFTHIKLD